MQQSETYRLVFTPRFYPDLEMVQFTYGEGQPLTEQEALDVFDKLRKQADAKMPFILGYRLVDTWMVGDRKQGQVWVKFESMF